MADMNVGGQVTAIVPQTFAEIQRVAVQVIHAGIVPSSLVKVPRDNDTEERKQEIGRNNVAAVASCIMAGAELGLPPMVSLRAFTVINGRPALYADGNVAVVRKAKMADGRNIAAYLKTGYTEVRDFICPVCKGTFETADQTSTHILFEHEEDWFKLDKANLLPSEKTLARTEPTDKSHAWCEAKRADNDEVYRETFSIGDAKKAGLWETEATITKFGWHYSPTKGKRLEEEYTAPNDSPWFRFYKRMLGWRAIGYCLRWLFADVLGGMSDEYEVRDISAIDITPALPPSRGPDRPKPPAPPTEEPDAGDQSTTEAADGESQDTLHNSDQPEGAKKEAPAIVDDMESAEDQAPPAPAFVPKGEITPAINEELEQLSGDMLLAADEATIEEAFDEADVQTRYAGNDVAIARAFQLKDEAIAALAKRQRKALEDAGQGDLLGGAGGPPMPPEGD